MGWASMKSLSGPAHGLEPTAQQLRPLDPAQMAFRSERDWSIADFLSMAESAGDLVEFSNRGREQIQFVLWATTLKDQIAVQSVT
jgi:hypothetical protein